MKKIFESDTFKTALMTLCNYVPAIVLGLLIGSLFNNVNKRINIVMLQQNCISNTDLLELSSIRAIMISRKIDSIEYVRSNSKELDTADINRMFDETQKYTNELNDAWDDFNTHLDSLKIADSTLKEYELKHR